MSDLDIYLYGLREGCGRKPRGKGRMDGKGPHRMGGMGMGRRGDTEEGFDSPPFSQWMDEMRGGGVDEQAARELSLHIDNDQMLDRQKQSMWKNLTIKIAQGRYNRDQASKLFMYLADAAAQSYNKRHGSGKGMGSMFSKPTRMKVAAEYRDEFESEFKNNPEDFKQWVPKKYASKSLSL